MSGATTLPLGSDVPPGTPPGRTAVPERLAHVIQLLDILNTYGRHMHVTMRQRSFHRSFATIAQFFGTIALALILPRIRRGIMRCDALRDLLIQRAQQGRELVVLTGPEAARRAAEAADRALDRVEKPLTPEAAAAAEARAQAAAVARAAARIARREAAIRERTEVEELTMAQIEAQVRRAPVGRSLVLICQDMGVFPGICRNWLWSGLFDAIRWYGGSLRQLIEEQIRRETALARGELDRNRELDWPRDTQEGLIEVFGFLAGDPPVNPHGPEEWPPSLRVAARQAAGSAAAATPAARAGPAAATGPPGGAGAGG